MWGRVAGNTNQVGGDFRWQLATFDNPALTVKFANKVWITKLPGAKWRL